MVGRAISAGLHHLSSGQRGAVQATLNTVNLGDPQRRGADPSPYQGSTFTCLLLGSGSLTCLASITVPYVVSRLGHE